MYYSLKVKYLEPYENEPQTLSTCEETSLRLSHVLQCNSASLPLVIKLEVDLSTSGANTFLSNFQCL